MKTRINSNPAVHLVGAAGHGRDNESEFSRTSDRIRSLTGGWQLPSIVFIRAGSDAGLDLEKTDRRVLEEYHVIAVDPVRRAERTNRLMDTCRNPRPRL